MAARKGAKKDVVAEAEALVTIETETVAEAKGEKVVKVYDFGSLEDLQMKFKTKSAVIRFLAAEHGHGLEGKNLVGPISKFVGVRYQHVRNVLTQPLKRGAREDHTNMEVDSVVEAETADGDE
jgi:hypothetical protein